MKAIRTPIQPRRRRLITLFVAAATLLAAVTASGAPRPAQADSLPEHLTRLTDGSKDAFSPTISDDGRFVLYNVPEYTEDNDFIGRVVLLDRQLGIRQFVGDPGAQEGRLSADGSTAVYVAYHEIECYGSPHSVLDVYRWQRSSGISARISNFDDCEGLLYSPAPRPSADGRYIVYQEETSNFSITSTYRYDATSGTTQLIGSGVAPVMSDNGRYVVFLQQANESDAQRSMYSRDCDTGTTSLIPGGVNAVGAVSNDGRYVTYEPSSGHVESLDRTTGTITAIAPDVLPTDPDMSPDGRYIVYAGDGAFSDYDGISIWDRATRETTQIGSQDGVEPSVSADGRYVVFRSPRSESLSGDDANGINDIYLWTRPAAATVPGQPAPPTATPGGDQVTLSWTPPDDGGQPITGYRITPYREGVAQTPIDVGNVTSKAITGLRGGASYRFTVAARNAGGLGPVSSLSVTAVPKRSSTESIVVAGYQDFVGRAPTEAELSYGAAILGANPTPQSRAQFTTALSRSDTYLAAVINKLYRDTLGRNGDSGGIGYWTNELRTGHLTVAQVAGSFYASPEYFAGFGHNNLDTWVRDLYQKVLLRAADPGGVAYWVGVAQRTGRYNVAYPIYQSAESSRTRVKGLYQHFLGRPPDTAGLNYWAGRIPALGDLALASSLAVSQEYLSKAAVRYP